MPRLKVVSETKGDYYRYALKRKTWFGWKKINEFLTIDHAMFEMNSYNEK